MNGGGTEKLCLGRACFPLDRAQRFGTIWNYLERPPGSMERAQRSQCIVRWQDGIAPYSISVLISIAQNMLFLSLLIDRLQTCCRLNADLMQSLRKIHLQTACIAFS